MRHIAHKAQGFRPDRGSGFRAALPPPWLRWAARPPAPSISPAELLLSWSCLHGYPPAAENLPVLSQSLQSERNRPDQVRNTEPLDFLPTVRHRRSIALFQDESYEFFGR